MSVHVSFVQQIQIVNKSAGDIYLNDKAVPKNSARPLLTNNIIKMCDGVEFLWINKNDKENLKAELNGKCVEL